MGVDQGDGLASSVCLFFNGKELKLAHTLKEYDIKNLSTIQWLTGFYCDNSSATYLQDKDQLNIPLTPYVEKKVKAKAKPKVSGSEK